MKRLMVLILVLCFAPVDVNAELVSHWAFDEGEGITAYDSVNGNHGLIQGATWTTGKINSALYFDGVNDYVNVMDDPSLRFSQYDSFSISFWAKPIAPGFLLTKMRASAQYGYFGYEITWSDSQFCFILEKSRVANVYLHTPEDSAPADIWHFVTVAYDNKNMEIYLNGELSGSGTFNLDTGLTMPDKNLSIGARSYDTVVTGYFTGTLDDIRIYDHAIPEPATILLLGLGGLIIRRQKAEDRGRMTEDR